MTEIGKGYVGILFDKARIGRELGEALAAGEGEAKAAGALLGHGVGLGIAAGVGVAVAAGAGLFVVGEEFEKQYNRIRVATGKTGEELHGLEDTFKQVASDVPASFGSVGTAISDLSVRLGLTGEPLRAMSDQLLELSRITGTDIATNVTNVSQLFNNFGIGAAEQAGKLDELFRASQATGVGVSDLAAAMATGGAVFRQLGFSFEDSAALLGLLNKAGVDAGAVMMPLSKAIATAAKAGVDAGTMFRDLFDGIRNGTATTEDAIKVFGARAGPRLFGLIREGKLSYEELSASIAAGGDSIMKAGEDTMTLGDKVTLLWNRIKVGVEPIAMWVVEQVNAAFDAVGVGLGIARDAIDVFVGYFTGHGSATIVLGSQRITDVIATIGEGARTVFDFLSSKASEVFGAVGDEMGRLADFYGPRLRDLWAELVAVWDRDVYPALHDKVLPILKDIGAWIRDHMTPILVGLGVGIGLLVSPIATIAAGLVYSYAHFKTFRDVVDGVVKWLHDKVPPAFFAVRDSARAAFVWIDENVVPIVQKVIGYVADQISHLAAWWSQHWDSIHDAARNVLMAMAVYVDVIVQQVMFIWNNFGDQIMAVIELAWGQVRNIVETTVRIVGDVIAVFVDLLSGNWGKAWNDVKDILGAAIDYVTTMIGNLGTFAWDFFSSLPGNIITALGDIAGVLATIGLAAANGFWDAIKATFANVLDWFTALPGRIVSAIGDLASTLFGAGADLVKGFINGIKSALGGIPGAITNPGDNPFHDSNPNAIGNIVTKDVGGWIEEAYNQPVRMVGHGGEYVLSNDMLRGHQPIDERVLAALVSGRSGGSSVPIDTGLHIHGDVNLHTNDVAEMCHELPDAIRVAAWMGRP